MLESSSLRGGRIARCRRVVRLQLTPWRIPLASLLFTGWRVMASIHEKIATLLDQRKLKRRDLAEALGVAPQTATDICKGRSAITIQHLRNLVRFFGLRADYWLDETRLLPGAADRTFPGFQERLEALARSGMLQAPKADRLYERLRRFARENREQFLQKNQDLTSDELQMLGLTDPGQGMVGRL